MLIDSKYWVSVQRFDARLQQGISPCSTQLTRELELLFNYFNLSFSASPHQISNYIASLKF